MPTIVTGNCQRSRFTDCVTVCSVACFHGDDEMLYIINAERAPKLPSVTEKQEPLPGAEARKVELGFSSP